MENRLLANFPYWNPDSEIVTSGERSPGSIGVEGKQQKKSKNYTKNALRVADNAMIEGACIHREARRWSNVEGEEEEKISGKQK